MPAHFEPIICECCGKRAGGILRWYRCGDSFEQRSAYEAAITVSGGGPLATLKGLVGRELSFANQRICWALLRQEGYEKIGWERANGFRAEHPIIERPPAMPGPSEGAG